MTMKRSYLKHPAMLVHVSMMFTVDIFVMLSCIAPNEEMFADFLRSKTCYDLIPTSTKLVVFDTKLRVSPY